MPGTVYYQ